MAESPNVPLRESLSAASRAVGDAIIFFDRIKRYGAFGMGAFAPAITNQNPAIRKTRHEVLSSIEDLLPKLLDGLDERGLPLDFPPVVYNDKGERYDPRIGTRGGHLCSALLEFRAGLGTHDATACVAGLKRLASELQAIREDLGPVERLADAKSDYLLERRDNGWHVFFEGKSVVIATTLKGFTDLARLLDAAGEPISARELFGAIADGELEPVLDESALTTCRREADAARAEGRLDDAEEIEVFLRSATDKQGSPRRQSVPAKKARDAVRNRIGRAMENLQSNAPDLHGFLADRLDQRDPYRVAVREGDPRWIVRM